MLMKKKKVTISSPDLCVKDKAYIQFAQLTFLLNASGDLNFIILNS